MEGLNDAALLYVTGYPAAWRIEVTNEEIHRGFEYVRSELVITRHSTCPNGSLTLCISFYWGPTKKTWDLAGASGDNGAPVTHYPLIPMDCS